MLGRCFGLVAFKQIGIAALRTIIIIFSVKSSLMLSIHLHVGLPFLLFHGTSITVSLLLTCDSLLFYVSAQLYPTFLHLLYPTFVFPISLCFLTQHPDFCHLQLLLLYFLRFPCLGPVHHCRPCKCHAYFATALWLIFRSHKTPDALVHQ